MDELEGLLIYKQYMELIFYTENIVLKYPKCEKNSLVANIKNLTYQGMRKIIKAQKELDKNKRLLLLRDLDVDLKMIKVMIRISNRKKYINSKNYASWSKKLMNIGNLLGGWINSCVKR